MPTRNINARFTARADSGGFVSLDRGQGVQLEGERQLADFIGTIGRRAAERAGESVA